VALLGASRRHRRSSRGWLPKSGLMLR
jgi:hypothetical protein